MKGRLKGFRSWIQDHRRTGTFIGCMGLALIIAVVGFNLTKDKAKSTVASDVQIEKAEDGGSENMAENPLKVSEHPKVDAAVQEYYTRLAENTDFVEQYNNVQVFTKEGKNQDTYVVFARYDMKIKDVYTELPGLGTLYVDMEEEGGQMQVNPKVEKDVKMYVEKVASHEDVQQLMTDIQTDYANAVASDALLEEALRELESAVQIR